MAWTLYELARRPDHQERIRAEIAELMAQRGTEKELTPQDYDGLVFLNAVIKVRHGRPGIHLAPVQYFSIYYRRVFVYTPSVQVCTVKPERTM